MKSPVEAFIQPSGIERAGHYLGIFLDGFWKLLCLSGWLAICYAGYVFAGGGY